MNRWINYVALPATLIGTAATAVIVQSQIAVSQTSGGTANQPQQQIKQFTVRIDVPGVGGSGVIVNKEGNTYTVLTNWHVIAEAQSAQYAIQTHDGQSHPLTNSKKRLQGADLAVVYFTSNNEYPVAQIGDSDELGEGQTIVFAGYGYPRPREGKPTFLSYTETVTGRLQASDIKNGYELTLSGDAVLGMSGGPILNTSGELIGIYGTSASEIGPYTTYLYGIPINTAVVLAKLIGIDFPQPCCREEEENPDIISESTGVDYSLLWELLTAKKWQEANRETERAMLQAVNREYQGYFRSEDTDSFSCEDLRIIDQLWLEASDGKFGFSVQKEIYHDLGGTRDDNQEVWQKLGNIVGWRKEEKWVFRDLYNRANGWFTNYASRGQLPIPITAIGGGTRLLARTIVCDL